MNSFMMGVVLVQVHRIHEVCNCLSIQDLCAPYSLYVHSNVSRDYMTIYGKL